MEGDALTLSGVNAFYRDSHVLHDVSFALRRGHVLALLGRNGAGKTTCIHSIIGFVPVRTGTIELFGEPITGLPPETIACKGVGLVPQGRRVFPSLTVRENLTVTARRPACGHGPGWDLDTIFDTFPQLGERERQLAGSLSGGEQQMLAIARALVANPRILLLDEPSEGLAPQMVAEVSRVLATLRRQRLSIILVEQSRLRRLRRRDQARRLSTSSRSAGGATSSSSIPCSRTAARSGRSCPRSRGAGG